MSFDPSVEDLLEDGFRDVKSELILAGGLGPEASHVSSVPPLKHTR